MGHPLTVHGDDTSTEARRFERRARACVLLLRACSVRQIARALAVNRKTIRQDVTWLDHHLVEVASDPRVAGEIRNSLRGLRAREEHELAAIAQALDPDRRDRHVRWLVEDRIRIARLLGKLGLAVDPRIGPPPSFMRWRRISDEDVEAARPALAAFGPDRLLMSSRGEATLPPAAEMAIGALQEFPVDLTTYRYVASLELVVHVHVKWEPVQEQAQDGEAGRPPRDGVTNRHEMRCVLEAAYEGLVARECGIISVGEFVDDRRRIAFEDGLRRAAIDSLREGVRSVASFPSKEADAGGTERRVEVHGKGGTVQ